MRIFVYGSLLRGFHNHRLLEPARFIGDAYTGEGFALHDLGGFPAMVPSSTGRGVTGEVYDVDAATLARLDRLEGHPHFYQRTPLVLSDGSRAETYMLSPAQLSGCPVISSGSWRQHRRRDREPCELF